MFQRQTEKWLIHDDLQDVVDTVLSGDLLNAKTGIEDKFTQYALVS